MKNPEIAAGEATIFPPETDQQTKITKKGSVSEDAAFFKPAIENSASWIFRR
jgi:hypothetical protein